MNKDNIVYGKTQDKETGEWVEDLRFIARKFGDVTKACFACTKALTCEAVNIEDCKWETPDNVVCFPCVEEEPVKLSRLEKLEKFVELIKDDFEFDYYDHVEGEPTYSLYCAIHRKTADPETIKLIKEILE